jgi:hypothetical protein
MEHSRPDTIIAVRSSAGMCRPSERTVDYLVGEMAQASELFGEGEAATSPPTTTPSTG